MAEPEDRLRRLESEIERRLVERFAGIRDEFERLRLESDRRWEGFLSRFDQDFSGLVPPELVNPPEPEASSEPASDLPDRPAGAGLLSIEVARSLDDAGNQVEALHRFLDLCRRHASRAALLIAKPGGFAVWKATGFSEHGGNDEAARRVTLPLDGGPLAKVIEGSAFRLNEGNDVSERLGASDAVAAVLVPMVVKEKVSGAVYADTTAENATRFDPESIAFLTFLAGLFVDRLAARKLKPAPALRSLEFFSSAAPSERTEELEPQAASREEAASRDERDVRDVRDERDEKEAEEPASLEMDRPRSSARESYGTQILSFEASQAARGATPPPAPPPMSSEPDFSRPDEQAAPPEPERWPAREAPESAPEPEPSLDYGEPEAAPPPRYGAPAAEPPPPPAPPPAPPPEVVRPVEVAPPRPSAGVGGRRLAGPLAQAEGDERRDEARRFAKLLVSEIKLYNEKSVQEGRLQGNLYERLKEDIDRSRQMYDERIPEDVRSSSNFFYEELVRILADGRAEALGI